MTFADKLYDLPPQDNLPKPVILDRSTIGRYGKLLGEYGTCPAQGVWCEQHPKQTGSIEADAGNEGHDVFSWAIGEWIASGEIPADNMVPNARMARPDVQREVLAAVRPVVWSLSKLCRSRSPDDILRYDGGEGGRSGQLAMPLLPANPARGIGETIVTAELDLVLATGSKAVQRIIDWKCGRMDFTYTEVGKMFQARFYAMLVHENYPAVDRVEFQIVQTRKNKWVPAVYFTKRDAEDCKGEVLRAVEERWQALHVKSPDTPKTWPGDPKCFRCPKVFKCDHAHQAPAAIAKAPVRFLETTMHLEAMVKARRIVLDKWADAHGPIVSLAGTWDRHTVENPKKRPYSFREKKT